MGVGVGAAGVGEGAGVEVPGDAVGAGRPGAVVSGTGSPGVGVPRGSGCVEPGSVASGAGAAGAVLSPGEGVAGVEAPVVELGSSAIRSMMRCL